MVALFIVLIGALAGMDPPLNPLMMLWVNLIMDTMGALALGTEEPTMQLLQRRPYRRDARLISWPMLRNILAQSFFQLVLLLWLLFDIQTLFSGVRNDNVCKEVRVGFHRRGSAFGRTGLVRGKGRGGACFFPQTVTPRGSISKNCFVELQQDGGTPWSKDQLMGIVWKNVQRFIMLISGPLLWAELWKWRRGVYTSCVFWEVCLL